MTDTRPDPDEILKKILEKEKNIEQEKKKGKLKVFLGLAAGVGKTYRMLTRAQMLKESGIDVVIGIIETHGRAETKNLAEGIETLPRKEIEYGGIKLEEMDIDAIIKRKPELVLVDELAHTNAPGSRHNKRYLDVVELLENGIDVYTTLNVQHIESFNDIVFQITGVRVKETVPDEVLERAHHPDGIEVVDLPPEELIQRLKDGKVYVPEKSKQAIERFFRKGNLLALREMALRYTARLVDEDIKTYMERHDIVGPWSAAPRLLVCVSPSPTSARLIRLAKQLAPGIDAEWYAIHVEERNAPDLTSDASETLASNLGLAEKLGGEVVTTVGSNIADEVIRFAREKNIIIILIGYGPRQKFSFNRKNLVNEVVRKSGNIHILVVTDSEAAPVKSTVANKLTFSYKHTFYSLLTLFMYATICFFLNKWLNYANIVMLMTLPVIFSAIVWGRVAGIINSIVGMVLIDLFFIPPLFQFTIEDINLLPSLLVYLVVGLTTSFLAEMIRWQGKIARQREIFIESLYNLSRELLVFTNPKDITKKAVSEMDRVFECKTVFFEGIGDDLTVLSKSDELEIHDKDRVIATWSLTHGEKTGKYTDTLPHAELTFVPINIGSKTKYVAGFKFNQKLTPEQSKLLDSFINVIATSLSIF
ncbi:MAG TPA: DUF4118 domain-containing protein [Caldisericia bacterium]|mgnify:FL=1|nr:DUF4118 domain-containing protein [Caldisericia bacterium]